MEHHFKIPDDQFEIQFRDTSLDPKVFSHEAHLRLAWLHIKRYGLTQAISNVCEQIKRFDQVHGDGMKYNKDLTVACVELVHGLLQRGDDPDFQSFLKSNPELKTNLKGLIDKHLKDDRLNK